MHDVGRVQRSGAMRHTGNRVRRLVTLLVTLATALTGVVVGLTGATAQAAPTSTWCPDFTIAAGEVACATSPLTLSMSPTQVVAGSTRTYTFDASLGGAANLPQPTGFALFIPAGFTRPQLTNPAAAGYASVAATGPCASAALTGVTGGGSRPWRVAGVASGCGGQFGAQVTYTGAAPRVPSPHRFWLSTALQGVASLGSNAQVLQTVIGPPAQLVVSVDATSKSAGSTWTPTVRVTDAFGNPTPVSGSLRLTTNDPNGTGSLHVLEGGVAVVTDGVRLVTAGTRRITATLQPGGLTGSVNVTVTPAPTTALVLSAPSSVTLGAAVPAARVSAVDQFGNTSRDFTGTVGIGTQGTGAGSMAELVFTSADQGLKSIPLDQIPQLMDSVGTKTMTASILTTSITAERNVAVRPGVATRFDVTGLVDGVEGIPQTVTVTARDAFGNIATGYRGTVRFSSTDPRAILPADATLFSGQRTFSRIVVFDPQRTVLPVVVLGTPGPQTLSVADTADPSITGSQTVNIIDTGEVAGFQVTGLVDAPAGTRQLVTVRAVDARGDRVTGFTGTVSLTSTDPRALLPVPVTFSPNDFGVRTVPVTLRTAGPQTVTATDSTSAVTASVAANVAPAAASRLAISGLATGPAGVPQTVTVTARDAFGNVATGFTGTVSFSSNDPVAVLPSEVAFTAGDAGVRSFQVTLRTASPTTGSADRRTVTVASTGITSVTAAATITGGTPVRIELRHGSANGPTSARAIGGAPQQWFVLAFDIDGNRVSAWPGSTVRLSSDRSAAVPAERTLGTGAWTVRMSTIGQQTLTARLSIGTTVLEATAAVEVGSGPATRLAITRLDPGGNRAVGPRTVTVTALDAFGNVATSYRGTVTFGTDVVLDPGGRREGDQFEGPVDYTFRATDAGRVDLEFTFRQATPTNTVRLIARDETLPGFAATPYVRFVAGPAATVRMETEAPGAPRLVRSPLTDIANLFSANDELSLTLAVEDSYGNPVAPASPRTVTFSSSDPLAILPPAGGTYTPTSAFRVVLRTVGAQQLTVSVNSGGTVLTETVAMNINGALHSIRLELPPNVTPGVPFSANVSLLHADGQPYTGVSGPLDFSSDDPEATMPTRTWAVPGQATTSIGGIVLWRPGTTTVTVTSPGLQATATVVVAAPGDAFADALPISGGSGSVGGSMLGATREPFEPPLPGAARSVWVRWTSPVTGAATFSSCHPDLSRRAPMIEAFTGSTLQGLELVPAVSDMCTATQQTTTFPVTAGEIYSIRVSSDGPRSGDGPFTLSWSTAVAGIAGDAFEQAIVISGSDGVVDGSNLGAGSQPDEPETVEEEGANRTIWYRWTAPSSGRFRFDTCADASLDTMLAVYTGTNFVDLQRVASSDQGCSDQSVVTFLAVAGTTYHVQVDGWDGEQGPFRLGWRPAPVPANDAFATATVLPADVDTAEGTTVGATAEVGEPASCEEPGCVTTTPARHTVWYSWTPSADADWLMTACSSSTEAPVSVSVYTGSSLAGLTRVASASFSCDPDSFDGFGLFVVAGTTYSIQVDAAGDVQGAFRLSWLPFQEA